MQQRISVANAASIEESEDFAGTNINVVDTSSFMYHELRHIIVKGSGEFAGVHYDVLVKYGHKYIPKNTWVYIKQVTKEYFGDRTED